jgi:hypothetical protein
MESERQVLDVIIPNLTHNKLRESFELVMGKMSSDELHQEVGTISGCIKRANELIASSEGNNEFNGIRNAKRVLGQYGVDKIPNPFVATTGSPSWMRSLVGVIRVGNKETGITYRDPAKINKGNPLSVFRWYLYDGVGRMVAIRLGMEDDNIRQADEGEWITCAIAEAAIDLAHQGNSGAKKVVKDMVGMGFISKDWRLSAPLVKMAKALPK